MDYVSFAILCEELERADTAFRVVQSVHVGLNSLALLQWGTEEQRQRWLVPQARGEKLATFGLTEPGVGTDAGEPGHDRPARRRRYRLNGAKLWISLADVADHFLVFAIGRPERRAQGRHRLPARARDARPDHRHAPRQARHPGRQHRARSTSTTSSCPVEHRIGEEGEGFLVAMSAIDQGRYTVAAGAVGLAQACLDASRQVRPRAPDVRPGDRPAPARQAAASPRWSPGTEIGRLLVWRAGWLKNQGRAQHARDEPGQVARDRARGPERARRHPGPRRQRLQRRVPGRALPAQLEGRRHLRGHEPAAHAHPGRLRAGLSRGPAAALRAVAGRRLGAAEAAAA